MEKLLPYYERELAILRTDMRELALRFPKLSEKLSLACERCSDPAAEQAIRVTAFLCGRIRWGLDHAHPCFTNDLLGIQAPFYLRPIPSRSVIQINETSQHAQGSTGPWHPIPV